MPICYKCGKSLSSEQALTYHLNRKYKCGTWKCVQCNISFNTKFDMNIHLLRCEQMKANNDNNEIPSSNILMSLFNNVPLSIFIVDEHNHIASFTPYAKRENPHIQSVLGKSVHAMENVERLTSELYIMK